MANANTFVTLDDLHAAIVGSIAAKFPSLATVEAYRLDRKSLPVPAVLIALTELEADQDAPDPGTGQLAVMARFEAVAVVGFRTTNAKLEVRKLAAALAHFALRNRWGCPVGPAEIIGCYQDDFYPELDQYECWRIEWRQIVHIGSSVWIDNGTPPTNPVYSWAPDIGIGHEADYEPIENLRAPDGGEA